MDDTGKPPEADTPGASPDGAGGGSKPRDRRGERLAAALRANLTRRKSARREGLADFTSEGDGTEET